VISTTEGLDLERIVWRIAAFGLENGEPKGAPLAIGDEMWGAVLNQLKHDRITGFAVAGTEMGRLALSDEQTEEILEAHRQAMLAPLAVERALLEVAAAFASESIQFVVLKGPALAHTVYPDPTFRYFGDLDLLVKGGDWARVTKLLEGLGYRRNLPEPRAGFDRRFGKASEFRRESGIEIDLHRTLVVGPFGLWIEPDRLFEETTELRLWGQELRRLDDTLLQIHACIHASLGWWPPLMVPVRDVLQVAHFGRVDWRAVAERSAQWKLRAVVRYAFQVATERLGVGPPPGAEGAVASPPNRREQRALLSYHAGRRSHGGHEISTIRAISGLRAKAAYVRALMFPNREFLEARSGSRRPSYLSRWAIPIRWLLRRRGMRRRGSR
jgi:hypothetical protein